MCEGDAEIDMHSQSRSVSSKSQRKKKLINKVLDAIPSPAQTTTGCEMAELLLDCDSKPDNKLEQLKLPQLVS